MVRTYLVSCVLLFFEKLTIFCVGFAAEYGAELHTELLDMEVTALCLDNQQQFSAASPLGYYPSSGAPVVTSVAPSHYARPSARSSHTDAAIDRYLSAPVALQSWRREQLSQGS